MRKLLTLFVGFIILFTNPTKLLAITDPVAVSNNKFGIHIIDENDLTDAIQLVNSSGGSWGYVTIVIKESERDAARWQRVFDQMRRDHIIPIIRLATKLTGENWDAPQEAEINNWIAFLNSLNWVIQNRYIIVNNEPNHAKEWGGRLDPAGYAKYLKTFSQKLKEASPDFFVLPAGLDPAASNKPPTMSSLRFIREMKIAEPEIFNFIDGWTSHPYPTASISSYKDELAVIGKKLPVFITETGWTLEKYSEPEATQNIINAYKNTWNDPQVIAVTPFVLNYPTPPFNLFSWKKSDGSFYTYYHEVQKLPKIKGEPKQVETGQIFAAISQPVMFADLDFVGAILAKNTGQTIWAKETTSIGTENSDFKLNAFSLNNIEPTKLGLIFFRAAATQKEGVYTNSLFLTSAKGLKITNSFSIEGLIFELNKAHLQKLLGNFIGNFNMGSFLPF